MKTALTCLGIAFAVAITVLYVDRALIARSNTVMVSQADGFARWPTNELDSPLVSARVAGWDWWGFGSGCPPFPWNACNTYAHAWATYTNSGGTEFVVFLDYGGLRPAAIRFRHSAWTNDWRRCVSLRNCTAIPQVPQEVIERAAQRGYRLLART